MKKTLLILTALLLALTVEAKQTVVYKGEFATGDWAASKVLDKSLFANLSAGDIIYFKWTLVDAEYNQIQVSYPVGSWTDRLVTATNVKYTSNYLAVVLTADQVTNIKTNGLGLGGHFVIYNDVVIGDAFGLPEEIKYKDDGASEWSSAGTTPCVIGDWNNYALDNTTLATAKIGDRISLTFTSGASEWDSQLQIINNDGSWTILQGIPVGGMTSATMLIDENNIDAITHNNIRISGNNLTISDIKLERASLVYYLNSYGNDVDITKLPTTIPIDIDIFRFCNTNMTLCLPFDVPSVSTAFGASAKAYEFQEYSGGQLVFVEREHMDAGKPYYMLNVHNTYENKVLSFTGVTINTTLTNSVTSGGITFKGNYTPGMSMTGKYGITYNGGWGFFKGGSNTTLNAYSAYFDGTISASSLSITLDDETTGLKSIDNGQWTIDNYFDLQGRRVANPTKGLYIMNGKKVIIK